MGQLALFRRAHGATVYALVSTATPIVPIMIGDEAAADRFAGLLKAERMHVDAVKFPAVPIHKARLRVQLNAAHTRAQIDHLVGILEENQDRVGGEKPRAKIAANSNARLGSTVVRPWAVAAFAPLSRAWGATVAAFAGIFHSIDPRRPSLHASLNLVTLATAVLLAVDIYFDIPHLIFAYLLPILFVSIKFGRVPALITAVVSGLCAAFFLYEPTLSFYIEDNRDVAELASFCALAAMISYFFDKGSEPFAVRRL